MLTDAGAAFPSHAAVAYAIAGDRSKAIDSLEKAVRDQDTEIIAIIRFPAIATLKGDPRYSAVMKSLGLPD
jgi:hypothetical protein